MQRMVAVVCLVAGVLVLAGMGWALLAAGGLLWMRDDRAAVWLSGRWARLRVAVPTRWQRAREAPRRVLAGSMMGAGAGIGPTGVLVLGGIGWGLVAVGVVMVGLALLLGWGA